MTAKRWVLMVALVAACEDSTGTAGPATEVRVNAGNGQSAAAGAAVMTPPSVRVIDAEGRGVNGETVTFSVTSGGGAVTAATQVTSGDGVATVGSWTLGPNPGPNTMQAAVGTLLGSPVPFQATGTGVAFQAAHGVANGTGSSVALANVAIAGTNRLLLCVVGVEPHNSSIVPSSIALDDGADAGPQAMSQVGTAYSAPSDGKKWGTYHLVAPTVGARRVVATLSGSTNWTIACATYAGVDQVAPFGIVVAVANSTGAASIVATSNAAGSLPWAHIFSTNIGFAAGVGVTSRQASGIDRSAMVDANLRVPFAVQHTFNWTYSGQYGGQTVMIRPAAVP